MRSITNRFVSRSGTLGLLLVSCLSVGAAELIREIAVRDMGDAPVDSSYVYSHITSRVGEELSPEAVARDVRMLIDTRNYSYVASRIEQAAGGVRLIYVVEGRRRLAAPVTVRGAKRFSRSRVRELADLTPGRFIDQQLVATAASRVEAEYRRKRLFDARVVGEVVPHSDSPGAADVVFRIEEGKRYRVPLIRFKGNRVLSEARLRRHSGQSPWWNPAGWFSTKRVDSYDLELLRSDVRKQYADLGYLDAQISDPQIEVLGHNQQVSFQVREGLRYHVSDVEFSGVELFSEDTLRRVSRMGPGMLAAKGAIENSATAIRDYYAAQGYVDTFVRVTYAPSSAETDRVVLRYQVMEGTLATVRNIHIRGNTRTKDKVIRREITLNPGDIYNEVEAERSDRRLLNLGYFENVRHYDVESLDGTKRDVVYEVEEKPTGQFLIGAGFSSVDHLIGFMELSQGNFDILNWPTFTGGGQKARIGLQASSSANNIEASFVEPWFLDRRLSLNVDAFLRNRSYNEYDEQRYGGALGLSRHVPWVGRVSLTYMLQNIRLDDIIEGDYIKIDDPDTTYRYTDELDRYSQGSLRLGWLYQTTDNPLVPTRGTKASASLTLYGSALGGGPDMYELGLRARHYIPTFYGHVISFFVNAESIDTWSGDDEVPIGDRYFLGGGRNVRGFRYRAIGPKVRPASPEKDRRLYRPIGGQTMIQASAEYTIPITRFFRIAAFYDMGNVWADSFDADFSNYAASVGGGFRLDIPGFPIRLDYAWPLKRDDDYSRRQTWVFWVGFD